MKESLFIPSKAKYRIEIESPGFDMVNDNFELILKRGTVSRTFAKTDLVDKVTLVDGAEQHEYYLCFDTEDFGAGDIIVIVKAYVPDTDFEGGIRLEVDRFRLINAQSL